MMMNQSNQLNIVEEYYTQIDPDWNLILLNNNPNNDVNSYKLDEFVPMKKIVEDFVQFQSMNLDQLYWINNIKLHHNKVLIMKERY
jgi:hypothetical protein